MGSQYQKFYGNCSWCVIHGHVARDCRKKTEDLPNNQTSGWSGTNNKTKGKQAKARAKASKTCQQHTYWTCTVCQRACPSLLSQLYSHLEDMQFTEHEEIRAKPLSFHQSITASTYDSAESIATPPPDSDKDDEQLRALLASPLYLQEREANAKRSQVCHSERENLMSTSSQDPSRTGNLWSCFQAKIG